MRIVAATLSLSDAEKQILIDIIKGHSSRKDHIQRARMTLYCAKGVENTVVARKLNENKQTVGKWQNRWVKAAIQFEKIQLGHDTTLTLKSKAST